jgi:hypothetical protein
MTCGIVPSTLDWHERARNYYYAHDGMLNPEDGTLVPDDQI